MVPTASVAAVASAKTVFFIMGYFLQIEVGQGPTTSGEV
jgi:hypothetical protein